MLRSAALIVSLIGVISGALYAQNERNVTASDCVQVKYLVHDSLRMGLVVNQQGDRVAYLVKAPNLATNENDIQVYVATIGPKTGSAPKLLATNDGASSLQWEGDGQHLVLLTKHGGRRQIEEIDTTNGQSKVLLRADADIAEYSITPNVSEIAFAVDLPSNDPNKPDLPRTNEESQVGYRIEFLPETKSAFPERYIYIARRTPQKNSEKPWQISLESPLTGATITSIPYEAELGLSLSPDGSKLLLRYVDRSTKRPASWNSSPFVQKALVASGFSGTPLLALYDIASKKMSLPLESPFPNGVAVWAKDSRAFIIRAQSPVNSEWEQQDFKAKKLFASQGEHLFWVHLPSGEVKRVTPVDAQMEGLLSWSDSGEIWARTAPDEISSITQIDGRFGTRERETIPVEGLSPYAQMSGTSAGFVLDDQSLMTPPRLLIFNPATKRVRMLVNLNPQFTGLKLPAAKHISWKLPDGYESQGILFVPPGANLKSPQPLVIAATAYGGGFVCDSGELHLPAFAPLPMADDGLLYLMRVYPSDWTLASQQEHYPKGFPGGIGEAAFQAELWDSAVDKLAGDGLVDRSRVGLIGFSRTGWYTEFALMHGKTPYAAATAVDNVKYGLSEYWLSPRREGTVRGFDAMYGGPPFGATRTAWEKYSISFNMEKIRTPLLMEQMGYGRQYDRSTIIPIPLADSLEIYSSLKRMNKPVDFYYYPLEEHQPDHPLARLSSIQRNIDWYRFWLQSHIDLNPTKQTQYSVWRSFRFTLPSSVKLRRGVSHPQ